MTDHTWLAPLSKKGTVEYHGHVLSMNIFAETAGFDDPRLPLIVTGRLCALSRIIGPGKKIRVTRRLIEAPPDRWQGDD